MVANFTYLIIYVHKQDLALNNQQRLKYHKTNQPTRKSHIHLYIYTCTHTQMYRERETWIHECIEKFLYFGVLKNSHLPFFFQPASECIFESKFLSKFLCFYPGQSLESPLLSKFLCFSPGQSLESPRDIMVKVLNCGIAVSEFEIQSHCYACFQINTRGKWMNPIILLAVG